MRDKDQSSRFFRGQMKRRERRTRPDLEQSSVIKCFVRFFTMCLIDH